MKLIHYLDPQQGGIWGVVQHDGVLPLALDTAFPSGFLAGLLQTDRAAQTARRLQDERTDGVAISLGELLAARAEPGKPSLLPPLDHQEVWAAGVTYLRSKQARMEESQGAARVYDLVYDAARPELFFKATPNRVSAPNAPVRIRADSQWNVPEPEIALLLSPRMEIIGYSIGNDMSSRDIEGENPLYLPQAKLYAQSCALGPAILLDDAPGAHRDFVIQLAIERAGATAFAGSTSTGKMKRKFRELAEWLAKDNVFPNGAFLLTGTGLVPGEGFTLEPGDVISITVPEIGTLRNPVIQGGALR